MKTLTLLTSGTRGDVIPYLALGLGLRDVGYNVRLAAPMGFRQFVEPSGLAFAPFEGNPSDLMINQSDPLTAGQNLFRSMSATKNFLARSRAIYPRMLRTAAEACRGSDVLIYGLPTLWGAHIGEFLRIPAIRAVLQPLAPTREFSSALLPFRLNLLETGNRLSHWIVIQAAWLSFRTEINRTRRTHFDLPRAHWLDPSLRPFPHQPLTLNGFSEHILPRPRDWNEKQVVTGYWRLPPQSWNPPKELAQFLERLPQNTIAIGLGSPGTHDFPHILDLFEQALNRSDARAVLMIPSSYHSQINPERIFPIEFAPHEWLYPRVRLAIHHGGAGTTSASLHAGIPTVTLPLAIDQFFWGERVYKIGVGPKPIPQRALNANKLATAIQHAMEDASMRERAKDVGVALGLENGVQVAVSRIRNL